MTVKKSDGSTRQINDNYLLEWRAGEVRLNRIDNNWKVGLTDKSIENFKEAIREFEKEKARETIFESSLTNRGSGLLEFKDYYNEDCSIQESSLATQDCLWIGRGEDRMHINQDMAEQIASVLFYFSKYGCLPNYFFKERFYE